MNWGRFIHLLMRFFRVRRLRAFAATFADLPKLTVLDVGGRPMIWQLMEKEFHLRPARLVLLNNELEPGLCRGYEVIIGDGCNMPCKADGFDLVFSNSVIEHVGSLNNMQRFANECNRVGKEVYIQTPYRWFPVEPYIVALFIHWLPRPIYRAFACFFLRRLSLWKNKAQFYRIFDHVHLLTRNEFQSLFLPEKHLWAERFLGMPKSHVITDRPIENT